MNKTDRRKIRVLFFSDGNSRNQSTVDRCLAMSAELSKYDITSKFYLGRLNKTIGGLGNPPNILSYLKAVMRVGSFDALFLHRMGNPFAYLVLLIYKLFGKKVIYDFDDALFSRSLYADKPGSTVLYFLFLSFLPGIIRKSDLVTCGSHFVMDYAGNLNSNTHLIPTPVNTGLFHPMKREANSDSKVIIGWVGSGPVHYENLKLLAEPLRRLSQSYGIKFKLVGTLGSAKVKDIFSQIESLDVDFGLDYWVDLARVPDLMADFDISVMPLAANAVSKGKCGTKALLSMAMGMPVVVSDVGENRFIVNDDVNGFLATSPDEWHDKLAKLIEDKALRGRLGSAALKTVEEKYSLEKCGLRMAELLHKLYR